jgi:hypothetical protein
MSRAESEESDFVHSHCQRQWSIVYSIEIFKTYGADASSLPEPLKFATGSEKLVIYRLIFRGDARLRTSGSSNGSENAREIQNQPRRRRKVILNHRQAAK